MKVLRIHGQHDLRLHDEPEPVNGPTESLLQITAVGICGSDLHWYEEAGIGDATLERPLVLGHEFAAVGRQGKFAGLRVAVDPAVQCDNCQFCKEGNPNLCVNAWFAGHGLDDGALSHLLAWPDKCLFPIPDTLSDEDGAMLEPLGVAIHAVDLAHIKTGMTVSVHGCGPIGLLILQVARVAGATRILATDRLAHRLTAARQLGATDVFLANDAGDEAAEILKLTDFGVDVAFEAAGENPAVESALASVKPSGKIVLAGIPADNRISFSASVARRKGLTIKMARRMKHTYPRAIELVQQGLVDVRSLVSHCYPIEQFDQAFDVAHRRTGLKVIIKP